MSEKSRGFLMFAHNNEEVDYGKLAYVCATLIKGNLKENKVAVVTDAGTHDYLLKSNDKDDVNRVIDEFIIVDRDYDTRLPQRIYRDTVTEKNLTWFNGTRMNAYSLSPFDETILIDSDLLIQDSMFDSIWGIDDDVIMNKEAVTLLGNKPPRGEQRLSHASLKMYWATILYFKKSDQGRMFFDLCEHVKEKYHIYCKMYGFPKGLFRNDFVVSIAAHMMNGFVENGHIKNFPTNQILTSFDHDELVACTRDSLTFLTNDSDNVDAYQLANIGKRTVHCMNKFSILRNADDIIKAYANE